MEKIILKDFRPTKEIKLPLCGLTIVCYPSVLIGDLEGVNKSADELMNNLEIFAKVIKSWNMYADEKAEQPLPVNLENLKKLPATDFQFFAEQLKEFSEAQKKS